MYIGLRGGGGAPPLRPELSAALETESMIFETALWLKRKAGNMINDERGAKMAKRTTADMYVYL